MIRVEQPATRLKCEPLGDRVLIRPPATKEMSEGGIHLPQQAQERETAREGLVLAVGPGKWENGARTPMQVAPGDVVRYSPNAGSDIKIGDEELLILHERDCYVKIYYE